MSIAMDSRVVESHSDRVPESVDDPTRHSAKLVVGLDENLFDGIKQLATTSLKVRNPKTGGTWFITARISRAQAR
jgi:hypothetical protein